MFSSWWIKNKAWLIPVPDFLSCMIIRYKQHHPLRTVMIFFQEQACVHIPQQQASLQRIRGQKILDGKMVAVDAWTPTYDNLWMIFQWELFRNYFIVDFCTIYVHFFTLLIFLPGACSRSLDCASCERISVFPPHSQHECSKWLYIKFILHISPLLEIYIKSHTFM